MFLLLHARSTRAVNHRTNIYIKVLWGPMVWNYSAKKSISGSGLTWFETQTISIPSFKIPSTHLWGGCFSFRGPLSSLFGSPLTAFSSWLRSRTGWASRCILQSKKLVRCYTPWKKSKVGWHLEIGERRKRTSAVRSFVGIGVVDLEVSRDPISAFVWLRVTFTEGSVVVRN